MSERIAFAKTQVDETKNVMIRNIEKILERSEKLEDLDAKTQDLSTMSYNFQRAGRNLKCQMIRDNVCLTLAIILIILVVLGVTIFIMYEIIHRA